MKKKRTILHASAALGTAALLALAAPLAASAHVRVDPDQAQAGSYAVLTFRVPTESATASTTKLEVDFPTSTPFSSVDYQPVAGWTAVVTTSKLAKPVKIQDATITEAVTKVTWTAAAGAEILPGQFQQFAVTAGPVPDTTKVMMPAHQTYSDGSVVNWDQPTPASGDEPEHPAPTLYINATPPPDGSPLVTATAAPAAADPTAAAGDSSSDAVAIGLGIGGVALGAIAVVLAVFAITRRGAASGAPRDTRRTEG
jgi:uncharacterized protein YcnI